MPFVIQFYYPFCLTTYVKEWKIKKNCINCVCFENHDNFSSPKLMKLLLTFSLVSKHKLYPLSQTWPDHGVTCSGLLLYSYSYSIQWQSISTQEGLLYNPLLQYRCQIFVFFLDLTLLITFHTTDNIIQSTQVVFNCKPMIDLLLIPQLQNQ